MATTSPSSPAPAEASRNRTVNSANPLNPLVQQVEFSFEDPAFQADPYPTYALLREHEPVCRRKVEDLEIYWLTRFRDITALLRHPLFSAARTPQGMLEPGVPEKFRRLGHLLTQMMLLKDAPDHTRLRGLVNKAFTSRMVDSLRPRVESIV